MDANAELQTILQKATKGTKDKANEGRFVSFAIFCQNSDSGSSASVFIRAIRDKTSLGGSDGQLVPSFRR